MELFVSINVKEDKLLHKYKHSHYGQAAVGNFTVCLSFEQHVDKSKWLRIYYLLLDVLSKMFCFNMGSPGMSWFKPDLKEYASLLLD